MPAALVLTAAQCHSALNFHAYPFLTSLLCRGGLNSSQQPCPATLYSAGPFKNWMEDYFRKALAWAQSRASAVETSQLGLVQNALTHLHGAVSKRNFACALARGFGANMAPEHREELAAEVGRWTGEASLLVPAMDISEMLRLAVLVACNTAGIRCPQHASLHIAGPSSFTPVHLQMQCIVSSMSGKHTCPNRGCQQSHSQIPGLHAAC